MSQDCSPYVCGSSGTCKQVCVNINDCYAPNVCDPSGHCVSPPSSQDSGSSGGCSASPASGSGDGWLTLGAVAFFALVSRARRRRAA
jgi:MYXO-CTERM domain-containing protein